VSVIQLERARDHRALFVGNFEHKKPLIAFAAQVVGDRTVVLVAVGEVFEPHAAFRVAEGGVIEGIPDFARARLEALVARLAASVAGRDAASLSG